MYSDKCSDINHLPRGPAGLRGTQVGKAPSSKRVLRHQRKRTNVPRSPAHTSLAIVMATCSHDVHTDAEQGPLVALS